MDIYQSHYLSLDLGSLEGFSKLKPIEILSYQQISWRFQAENQVKVNWNQLTSVEILT